MRKNKLNINYWIYRKCIEAECLLNPTNRIEKAMCKVAINMITIGTRTTSCTAFIEAQSDFCRCRWFARPVTLNEVHFNCILSSTSAGFQAERMRKTDRRQIISRWNWQNNNRFEDLNVQAVVKSTDQFFTFYRNDSCKHEFFSQYFSPLETKKKLWWSPNESILVDCKLRK